VTASHGLAVMKREYSERSLNGWRAGLSIQVRQPVSMVFDFSDSRGSSLIGLPGGADQELDLHRQTYTAGIQVDTHPGLQKQWDAFVEAQLGAAHDSNRISFAGMTDSSSATAFAMKFGGGLDREINKHLGVRLFQFDYQPTHFGGAWQNNLGVSTGLVVHFGR